MVASKAHMESLPYKILAVDFDGSNRCASLLSAAREGQPGESADVMAVKKELAKQKTGLQARVDRDTAIAAKLIEHVRDIGLTDPAFYDSAISGTAYFEIVECQDYIGGFDGGTTVSEAAMVDVEPFEQRSLNDSSLRYTPSPKMRYMFNR